jgi:hypothetical protein
VIRDTLDSVLEASPEKGRVKSAPARARRRDAKFRDAMFAEAINAYLAGAS